VQAPTDPIRPPVALSAGQELTRLRDLFLTSIARLEDHLFGLRIDDQHAGEGEWHLARYVEQRRSVGLDPDQISANVPQAERAPGGGD